MAGIIGNYLKRKAMAAKRKFKKQPNRRNFAKKNALVTKYQFIIITAVLICY